MLPQFEVGLYMENMARPVVIFHIVALWASTTTVYAIIPNLAGIDCRDSVLLDRSSFVLNYSVTPHEVDGKRNWTLLYEIEWQPTDSSALPFREDHRCGPDHPLANGEASECDPRDADFPCCSWPHGWCGNTLDHCSCIGCVDYRDRVSYREDHRCGPQFLAPNGGAAECDPKDYDFHCCSSPHGWCGNTDEHCECDGCVNYADILYFVNLMLDDSDTLLEPWNFSDCSDGLAAADSASGDDRYRFIPKYVGELPFTRKALFQVAYAITSVGEPMPVSRPTNVFIETPDCYAETGDADFCATQDVARSGQPRDVTLAGVYEEDDAIGVEFEWTTPVQINDMSQMQYYNVQIYSDEGDLMMMEKVTAEENVIEWSATSEFNGGLQENRDYILTVVPYVRNINEPDSPPLAGRLVAYPFVVELPEITTRSPTTDADGTLASEIPPVFLNGIVSVVVVVVVVVFLLLILLVVVCCVIMRKKRRQKPSDRTAFGNVRLSEMYAKRAGEQRREVDVILKDKEIPHDRVSIEHKIGEGEFGIVHKGFIKVTKKGKTVDMVVAVKTTKVEAFYDAKEELLDEMKLIAELGDHPNILSLVACCSTVEPFYLITEFMKYGDLLGFLRKCREPGDGYLDVVYNVGEVEQLIISRDIAKGMAHIQERRFYHGDLAARNVLIGDKLSVKISDFGLADDVYTRGYKRRVAEQKIPVKWCSMETILNGICSSQGDVWSFGILLYEVFTLGGTPYPGVAPRFLLTQLRQGYRMEQPEGCPDDVYDLMKRCWQDAPNDRPRFSPIAEELAAMLLKRTDYVEFDLIGSDNEEQDTERYVKSPVPAPVDRANLAPIDDADNEVDIDQLHSALKENQEELTVHE